MKMSLRKALTKLPLQRDQLPQRIMRCVWLVVFMFLFAIPGLAQNTIHVKGRVTNESGQPVQRASVLVKGTSNGVTGDENGNFEISAHSNGTLVITSVGFAPLEVKINNQASLNITLVDANKNLGEVVVDRIWNAKEKRYNRCCCISKRNNTS